MDGPGIDREFTREIMQYCITVEFKGIKQRPCPKGVAATPPTPVTESARQHAGPARTRRPRAAAPAEAIVDLLQTAGNPQLSGKSLATGLGAAPLPGSDALTLAVS